MPSDPNDLKTWLKCNDIDKVRIRAAQQFIYIIILTSEDKCGKIIMTRMFKMITTRMFQVQARVRYYDGNGCENPFRILLM